MRHLALLGDGPRLPELAGHLWKAGFVVTFVPEARSGSHHHAPVAASAFPSLALVEASTPKALERLAKTAEDHTWPWLFLCGGPAQGSEFQLTNAAYRAGALAVLPEGSSNELVVQAVERSVQSLQAGQGRDGNQGPRKQQHRAGDVIPLRLGEMLRVLEGVVAQVAWHEEGSEGLVGLWGPDHLLTGHPEDACGLAFRAHTDAVVEIGRPVQTRVTFESLLERVRRHEAWSSVQSRQNMQERLLGILALLAEQFGNPCTEGIRIDLRITHAQLAAAIGATRATVTRLLGPLKRRGQVLMVATEQGERLCLPHAAGKAPAEDTAVMARR